MINAKGILRYFIAFLLACFCLACGTSSLRLSNYAQLYSSDIVLHPDYRVYHLSSDSTALYFKLNTDNLLYNRPEKSSSFQARIRLEVQVFNSLEEKLPRASDSVVFVDVDNTQQKKDLIGSIRLAIPEGKNFICKVVLTDLNRNAADTKFLVIFKEPEVLERQGFLACSESGIPVVGRIIKTEESLLVRYKLKPVSAIRFLVLSTHVRPALPPFSSDTGAAESMKIKASYTIYDSAGYFRVPVADNASVFFFQADSLIGEGTSLLKFSPVYPKVSRGEDMIGPLRYLTTDEEYQQLETAPNKKLAAETFWIRCCGSKERAKEVIKRFYKRVEEANEYFTSYKEGWKTDRGMIYIMFGAPDGLYMRDMGESWVYGQDASMNQINCIFSKVDNPFTENDLILQRNPSYRPVWYASIESWRTGRVFTL